MCRPWNSGNRLIERTGTQNRKHKTRNRKESLGMCDLPAGGIYGLVLLMSIVTININIFLCRA